MSRPARHADVVVVGGGLHGCSAALHLARRGFTVLIVEKDHAGRHASSANAGGVRRLGRALAEIPLAEAALADWHRIQDLVGEDCGFSASCQIKVAETEAQLQAQHERRQALLAQGYGHEEMIDRQQLRELLPAIAPHCLGALVVHGDGHANPFLTVRAFRRRALALGAGLLEQTAVESLSRRGGLWRIRTSGGPLEAPLLVNCAGAWGGRIAAMLGEAVPIEAQAYMLMISARMPAFVTPVVGAQGRKLSFKQFDNGTVLIGGGHKGHVQPQGNGTCLDFRELAVNARSAATLFPIMRGARIVRCWAGIEGQMADGIPVIGASAAEGAYHAFGFSGHGFALSPVVGRIIAELAAGRPSALPIEAFDIKRFDPSKAAPVVDG